MEEKCLCFNSPCCGGWFYFAWWWMHYMCYDPYPLVIKFLVNLTVQLNVRVTEPAFIVVICCKLGFCNMACFAFAQWRTRLRFSVGVFAVVYAWQVMFVVANNCSRFALVHFAPIATMVNPPGFVILTLCTPASGEWLQLATHLFVWVDRARGA